MTMKNIQFKALRAANNVTQKEIELKTGIYAAKLSYFENGFASPTSEEAKLIAEVIGCKPSDVLDCFKKTKTPA